METVDEAVIDLHRHPQFLAAIFLAISAPCDAGDVVVPVKIPLVGAAGQIKPRCAGDIDEVVVLFVLVKKGLLGSASRLCGGTELRNATDFWQGDDVKLLTAGFQVGQTGNTLIQQPHLAVPDGVAEILHAVHGVRHEIPHRVIKRQMPLLDIAVKVCYIHPEGDAVKRVGNSGEKLEQFSPLPVGPIDFFHLTSPRRGPAYFYPACRTALRSAGLSV